MKDSDNDVPRVVHLVDPRITFAAERTLLAWIRTALALMGVGALIREIVPPGSRRGDVNWLAIALIAVGIAALLVAIIQHFKVVSKLRRGETAFEADISPGIAIALFLVLVGMAAALFMVFSN